MDLLQIEERRLRGIHDGCHDKRNRRPSAHRGVLEDDADKRRLYRLRSRDLDRLDVIDTLHSEEEGQAPRQEEEHGHSERRERLDRAFHGVFGHSCYFTAKRHFAQ